MWGMPDWLDYSEANPEPLKPVWKKPGYYYQVMLPLLKPGMQDEAVETVQCLLQIKKTGIMDDATVEAVKVFQRSRGLLADGEVGGDTWRALLRG